MAAFARVEDIESGAGQVLKEFKAFIMRGNLIEIAVAFIMGLAFAAVVTAFTGVVLGTIAYVLGSDVSFDQIGVHNDAGALVIPIGTFLTAVVDFIIIAFVLFLVVKAYNRMQKPAEAGGPTEIELLTEIRDSLRNR
jgi:large conductance mechanosensitive channel